MMRLPGGLLRSGARLREARFRPLTGEVELTIAESGTDGGSLPRRVTRVLAAALAEVGEETVTPEIARELCVADRQYLMYQLAAQLGFDPVWLSAGCVTCGERFDFSLRPAQLPVKEAGDGYPNAEISLGRTLVRLRVPNGGDQEAVAALDDPAGSERMLLERCIVSSEVATPVALWPAEVVASAEAALGDVAPAAVTRVQATCPACNQAQAVEVNPYLCLLAPLRQVLAEVHALAAAYHWSEREILALPADRRRQYVALVDRARGFVQ